VVGLVVHLTGDTGIPDGTALLLVRARLLPPGILPTVLVLAHDRVLL
jgi:hypothetical protein